MLLNFLACHRHLSSSLFFESRHSSPQKNSLFLLLWLMEISGDQDLIHFLFSGGYSPFRRGRPLWEWKLPSRDEYFHSASLSSCIDNQKNCLLLSQMARWQFIAFGMFWGKKKKKTQTKHHQKNPHFCIKNENLHKRLSNSPKGKGSNKREDTMTSLLQGIFPIYTLVTHTELLTTNKHINITL